MSVVVLLFYNKHGTSFLSRFQLKTQFDKNVVTHFEVQEQVCDYIFSHLGIDSDGCVPHPIVMTEAFVSPNYSRQCKLCNYVHNIILFVTSFIVEPYKNSSMLFFNK